MDNKDFVKLQLESNPNARKRKPKRVLPVKFPKNLPRHIYRIHRKYLANTRDLVLDTIVPKYRIDTAQGDVRQAVEAVRIQIGNYPSLAEAEMVTAAEEINKYNKNAVNRFARNAFGIDIVTDESWLGEVLLDFAKINADRIKDVSDDFVKKVAQGAYNSLQQGIRPEEFAKTITKELGVSDRRAKLIARNEVATLNGQLVKQRQQDLGITKFIWRTVGDERVRASHDDYNGQTFTWAEGSPEGVPGDPINCRCFAQPIIDDFFDD